MKIQKLTIASLYVALAVILSPINIPLGIAKCFPIQHLINVVAAVTLGPVYAVCAAFCSSLVRNVLGTGSLLAFPGSMIGALCAGLLYKYFKNNFVAYVGEVIGTGIIGGIIAYPVATFLIGKEATMFMFVIPFLASTVIGGAMGLIIVQGLKKTNILKLELKKERA